MTAISQGSSFQQRGKLAHCGHDRLMDIVNAVEHSGFRAGEVITSGTPAFAWAATYAPFHESGCVHRASPGTVVFNDVTSLAQLPGEWGYQPAAVVLSTVVSHPRANLFTCDAGHKAVSADAGVPTCAVAGHPDCTPLKPSEEHLPIEVNSSRRPQIGEPLYLIPRHVCPTVNNFDDALIIESNRVVGVEMVTARGHESLRSNIGLSKRDFSSAHTGQYIRWPSTFLPDGRIVPGKPVTAFSLGISAERK